jgi:hypothetical protein
MATTAANSNNLPRESIIKVATSEQQQQRIAPKHQESSIKNTTSRINHWRNSTNSAAKVPNRARTKKILQLQAALVLYFTFTMPFFTILTSIRSTKVVFLRVISLQREPKKGGKRIKTDTIVNKKRDKNKRGKKTASPKFWFLLF